jgi:hypothetical protein
MSLQVIRVVLTLGRPLFGKLRLMDIFRTGQHVSNGPEPDFGLGY